jgi:hypothetical protein
MYLLLIIIKTMNIMLMGTSVGTLMGILIATVIGIGKII